ncbi:MAG: hypothetical protein MI702_05135, partial [Chlorobiales bacterium]|nr:hypothetical protein [Chlorobiales bacterium]
MSQNTMVFRVVAAPPHAAPDQRQSNTNVTDRGLSMIPPWFFIRQLTTTASGTRPSGKTDGTLSDCSTGRLPGQQLAIARPQTDNWPTTGGDIPLSSHRHR